MMNHEKAVNQLLKFKNKLKEKGYNETEIQKMVADCAMIMAALRGMNLSPNQRTLDILQSLVDIISENAIV